jgi:hypothetical protein
LRYRAISSLIGSRSGPAISIVSSTGAPTAARATARATAVAAMGWKVAWDRRTRPHPLTLRRAALRQNAHHVAAPQFLDRLTVDR